MAGRGNPNLGNEIGRDTRFNSETAKIAQKKGVEVRRRNADMRATMEQAFNMKLRKGKLDDISKLKDFESLTNEKNYRAGDMLALQLMADAMNGDRTALDYVVKVLGILAEDANAPQTVQVQIKGDLGKLSE